MLYLGPVNSVKKSAKSKNTVGGGGGGDDVLSVLRIFYRQRKTNEVPTRYRADTGEDTVKSSQNFLFSKIVAVGPIRYRLRLHTVPTAIVMILPRTFPLSADPGEVIFTISILKRTSRYRRR